MPGTTAPPRVSAAQLNALRTHFESGATHSFKARRNALRALKQALRKNEEALLAALHADMRKPRFEAYMGELAQVHAEIDHALQNLRAWMEPEQVAAPLALWPHGSSVRVRPLGVVLIIAPWNYPVLLGLAPLVGAVAAGNCAVMKPSEEVPHTAELLGHILAEAFAKEHVAVLQGLGSEVVPPLITGFRFDHIFFTGSLPVGRSILAQAAPQLVPVTLELGGKSPAIVDRSAHIGRAAKRIAWSKFFNAGQTCIATDYALVHADVLEPFLLAFAKQTEAFYGKDPQRSPDYARLVNAKHFERVQRYLSDGRIRSGGQHDAADRYIAPTVLIDVPPDSPVMREEIFGPLLPVIPWKEPEEVEAIVRRNPTPLAFYLFSKDRRIQRRFLDRIPFGGGCINHCMLHFGDVDLPFGGVGTSGMGRYHGKASFDLFSHHQGLVQAGSFPEPGFQYPPYAGWKEKVIRRLLG
jgi:aldehyde dehydrogenase (NAD+)